jgi:hypothetical protein
MSEQNRDVCLPGQNVKPVVGLLRLYENHIQISGQKALEFALNFLELLEGFVKSRFAL